MKKHALAALAAASLAMVPAAQAAPRAAGSEIELHIEATAQIQPDLAEVPLTVSGSGATREEALADLARNEQDMRRELTSKGIDAAKVRVAAKDAEGKDLVSYDEGADAAAGAACAAADAAAMAAEDAASDKRSKKKGKAEATDFVCPGAEPMVYASKTLLVQVDDIAKISLLPTSVDSGSYPARVRPVFSQSDPAAARKKAREQALAKARAEADAYAAAMGYRVVRVTRVSNAKPAINLYDMFGFIATIDRPGNMMQPSWFSATMVETVAIDYVIAPK